jgi:putative Se/S carrier protein
LEISFGVVLFHTTSAVMRAEKVLQKNGITVKLIPTPRQFSSDCGMAVRFAWQDQERIHALLQQAHIETAGIHELAGEKAR